MPNLAITQVVLAHSDIVNNDYQQGSRVLYTFIPNKSYDQLLDIFLFLCFFIYLKTFNSEFSRIEVWFIDQNSKGLERKMMHYSVQSRDRIFVKGYGFFLLLKIWVKILEKT